MNKIEAYLELVPLPVLLLAPVAAVVVFMLVPGRLRLAASLAFTMVWLPMGLMLDLGLLQSLAKATGFATFILVTVAALLHPGPRRPLPPLAWGYVVTALLGFVSIWTVVDLSYALVIRIQWCLLVVATLAVTRTIVDERSLRGVGFALTLGMGVALLLPLSALVLKGGGAFKYGLRFSPWGTNANHIGTLFAFSVPLGLYTTMRAETRMAKLIGLATLVMGASMGVLTASRSVVGIMVAASLPMLMTLTRRPMATAAMAVVLGGAVLVAVRLVAPESVAIERLGSLDTGRVTIAPQYLEVIAEHPYLGLLETENYRYTTDDAVGTHSHNGYIETLYQGGLVWGIPVFFMVAVSSWSGFVLWRRRRESTADGVLLSLLVALMAMVYAHGFVNHSLYWPTAIIAFYHLLLSMVLLSCARELAQGFDPLPGLEHEDEDEWYDEEADAWPADRRHEEAPAAV